MCLPLDTMAIVLGLEHMPIVFCLSLQFGSFFWLFLSFLWLFLSFLWLFLSFLWLFLSFLWIPSTFDFALFPLPVSRQIGSNSNSIIGATNDDAWVFVCRLPCVFIGCGILHAHAPCGQCSQGSHSPNRPQGSLRKAGISKGCLVVLIVPWQNLLLLCSIRSIIHLYSFSYSFHIHLTKWEINRTLTTMRTSQNMFYSHYASTSVTCVCMLSLVIISFVAWDDLKQMTLDEVSLELKAGGIPAAQQVYRIYFHLGYKIVICLIWWLDWFLDW